MNGHCQTTTSRNDASILHLCRFELDSSSLNCPKVESVLNVSCRSLEDALDDRLDSTVDYPVEYPQADDALLLQCRLPRPRKTLLQQSSAASAEKDTVASITGISEEFEGSQKVMVNLDVYQGTPAVTTTATSNSCCCQAAISPWTRQNLQDATASPTTTTTTTTANTVDMKWVDLRACSNTDDDNNNAPLVPTLTSAAHLLRSLLGVSHSASPWRPDHHHQQTVASPSQRIALLFAGNNAPAYLMDVRVGDVCPSWFLYSISRLQVPAVWSPWEHPTANISSSTDHQHTVLQPATLLVYKQLPPRPWLSLTPPPGIAQDETHLQALPKGCLWESYVDTIQEDTTKEEKKADRSDTKKARKIPRCRMASPPYLSHDEDYSSVAQLQPLLDNWNVIRDEALQIPQWTAWPERQHYSKATNHGSHNDTNSDATMNDNEDSADGYSHPSWTVFPLCHCFPADQPENKKWIDQTCAFVPKTIQLLEKHLGPVLRTALFSRLDPETTLAAHTGWSDLANHVIRCHLPLTVPAGQVCGTWVDGCVETHQEGRFLCFDDSKTHRAFNYSGEERIVLILDLARPEHLPKGTATGGHTDELDQFIASMNV